MAKRGSSMPPSPPPLPLPLPRTVFVDTSIGTHLAVAVSIHDAISDVKAKIKADHALCFQEVGEITIEAIKVRRRGLFYSLADAMPVMNAFDGVKGSWCVCIDAVPICFSKDREVTNNKVIHEQLEHDDSAVHINCVDKHPEKFVSELSPKNLDAVNQKFLAEDGSRISPSISINYEKQNLLVAALNKLPSTASPSMRSERTSPALLSEVLPADELTAGVRSIKTSTDMVATEAQTERIVMPPFEAEKNTGLDEQGIHNPISARIDHEQELENLINQKKHGVRKKHGKKVSIEACDGILSSSTCKTISGKRRKTLQCDELLESQSQHHPVENKRRRKGKDGVREGHLEDLNNGSYFRGIENIVELHTPLNASQEMFCVGKKDIVAASSEGLSSKLEDTMEVQNLPVEKRNKKSKKKSEKCHKEVHLPIPEAPIAQSHRGSTYPNISCAMTDATVGPKEINDPQYAEFNPARSIMESDLRKNKDECVDARTSVFVSSKKILGQVQATDMTANGHSGDKHQGIGKETDRGVNSKESIEGTAPPLIASNIVTRSTYTKKKLNTERHQHCDAQKFIKEADPVADGAECLDTMFKISSSKKIPEVDQVANTNSGDSPIGMPPSLSHGSCVAIEQDAGNKTTSNHASVVPAKPRRSRFKSRSNGEIAKSNDGTGSSPSKLFDGSNQTVQKHCLDVKETTPFDESLSKLDEVPPIKSVDCLSGKHVQSNGNDKSKEGDITHVLSFGASQDQTVSKHKKNKIEVSSAETCSKIHIDHGLCKPDNANINFTDYFVPKEGIHDPAILTPVISSIKSKAGKKTEKTGRKYRINRLIQEFDTELVQTATHKQHVVNSQPQENDTIFHDIVDSAEHAVTKDSVFGNAFAAKNMKQSSRQSCCESDLFNNEATDLDKLGKKVKDHRFQPDVQTSRKGDVIVKKNKHIGTSRMGNGGDDSLVSKDEAPSDSTENTPYHLRRYRVVRKLPSRRPEKFVKPNLEKSLAPSSQIFDDASDSDLNPEEMTTKTTTALKSQTYSNSSASEVGSDEEGEMGKKADGSFNDVSRLSQKLPLSVILKSSSMYKKAKSVLQSELEDETESQSVDVVLETQPESSAS